MTLETAPPCDLPPARLSLRAQRTRQQAISFLMQQAVENPDVVSLAAGLVDPATLPVAETQAALQMLLADESAARAALQYGTTQGAEQLREHALRHLANLEGCRPEELGIGRDQLVLTNGSQQLLSLVAQVLLDPGDICLVAAPTYFVFLGTLAGVGARAIPVETDEHGMNMDALEAQLSRLEAQGELNRVKLIYLVSFYENPSGISLAEERRRDVVEIARRWSKEHRLYILEDAAYRELHFDGPQLPSVWSQDASRQQVILAQTFSKSFSPGVRIGMGVVPDELLGPICDRKGNEDFGSPNFNQHLLAAIFERGLYQSHVEQVRTAYREKRNCMLAAAARWFGDLPGVQWVHPHGGLYVWMSLPEEIATGFNSPLFRQATQVEKVMYVPGELFYAGPVDARPRNQMRLSFGVESYAGIELGMQRLANAVRAGQ